MNATYFYNKKKCGVLHTRKAGAYLAWAVKNAPAIFPIYINTKVPANTAAYASHIQLCFMSCVENTQTVVPLRIRRAVLRKLSKQLLKYTPSLRLCTRLAKNEFTLLTMFS